MPSLKVQCPVGCPVQYAGQPNGREDGRRRRAANQRGRARNQAAASQTDEQGSSQRQMGEVTGTACRRPEAPANRGLSLKPLGRPWIVGAWGSSRSTAVQTLPPSTCPPALCSRLHLPGSRCRYCASGP